MVSPHIHGRNLIWWLKGKLPKFPAIEGSNDHTMREYSAM